MLHKFFLLGVILLGFISSAFCQQSNTGNTVGLLYSEPQNVSEGVLLYAPLHSKNVFLIDNCGSLINQWKFDTHSNYSGATLLEDGSIIKLVLSEKDGAGIRKDACIEKRNWDNTLLWKFCGDERFAALHSDFYVLPNGNVLSLLKDRHSIVEAINAGAQPQNIIGNSFNLESVIEIKPTGISTGDIVWEWHLWDHLIQDFDHTKNNYSNIIEEPRRLDINVIESNVHFNSIDYNEQLDQILLSNWTDHEIYIIDHSTSIVDAANSYGGKYGYGGDFLFRWGNDRNFNVGKQALFGQHNPTWIPSNYGRFGGMISIFNNEYGYYTDREPRSAVVILNIDPDGDGVYDFLEKNTFKPISYEYLWTGKIFDNWMLSRIMSGVEVQPNGNLLICEATKGRFTEIDSEGNVVWIYKSPDEGTENDLTTSRGIIEQGVAANPQIYKIKKYPIDYAPLRGIKICNNQPIENVNLLTQQCVDEKKPLLSFNIKKSMLATYSFETEIDKADSIVWEFGDGHLSTELNPIHIFKTFGTYNVCLKGYNCFGSTEICELIEVGENIITNITTQAELAVINILPNPAKNHIKIVAKQGQHSYIASIYNVQGELVIKKVNFNKLVNITNLQSGVYIVEIKRQFGLSPMMLKFIKIN